MSDPSRGEKVSGASGADDLEGRISETPTIDVREEESNELDGIEDAPESRPSGDGPSSAFSKAFARATSDAPAGDKHADNGKLESVTKEREVSSEADTVPAIPVASLLEAAPSSTSPAEQKIAAARANAAPVSIAPGAVQLKVFGRTDVGQVREHNEDNFVVADLSKASRGLMETDRTQVVGERGTILGVCDGMGGAAAGEVASQLAVDIVYERMMAGDPPQSRDELAARLVGAIEHAGLKIFAEAKADRSRRGMGTTCTIAALIDDHLFIGQVGDSRGYILRKNRFVQVTRDQSLVNQLIEAGQLTEEEAETFEHNNIILQALGTADSVQVDLTYVELRRGDILLLCSDGLSGMVKNEEIREVLAVIDDPLEACRELTERANLAGGHDNVTVVVARFEGDGLDEPSDDEVAGLKYKKYELPEGVFSTLRPPPAKKSDHPPTTRKGGGFGEANLDVDEEDDYPLARREDPVELPRDQAPSWIVTMMIVSAVTCVVVAGYYLLR